MPDVCRHLCRTLRFTNIKVWTKFFRLVPLVVPYDKKWADISPQKYQNPKGFVEIYGGEILQSRGLKIEGIEK